jgi:hypothetical protein
VAETGPDVAKTGADVAETEKTFKTAVVPEVVTSAAVDVPMSTRPGAAAETLGPVLPLTDAQVSRVFFITSVATHKP